MNMMNGVTPAVVHHLKVDYWKGKKFDDPSSVALPLPALDALQRPAPSSVCVKVQVLVVKPL